MIGRLIKIFLWTCEGNGKKKRVVESWLAAKQKKRNGTQFV